MYEVKYVIWMRLTNGAEIECFRWTRNAQAGIRRAIREAKEFEFDCLEFWAINVDTGEKVLETGVV